MESGSSRPGDDCRLFEGFWEPTASLPDDGLARTADRVEFALEFVADHSQGLDMDHAANRRAIAWIESPSPDDGPRAGVSVPVPDEEKRAAADEAKDSHGAKECFGHWATPQTIGSDDTAFE